MNVTRTCLGVCGCVLLVFCICVLEGSPKYSAWSSPVNLGSIVNSGFDDQLPTISKDNLSLYFTSDRPGFGGTDIWVTQRANVNSSWGTPMNLGALINTSSNERGVDFSRDGHWMFFVSNRPGGFGAFDIWLSFRQRIDDDFGWQPPVNLGSGVNSSANDVGPSYFPDDDAGKVYLYFASSRLGGLDIYISEQLPSGSFGPGLLIAELSSPQPDLRPTIRRDGLEIFLNSARLGIGGQDLWTSTRESLGDPWSTPTNLGPVVNTPFDDSFPSLTLDAQTLYFNSDRPFPGSTGDMDLYVITRTKTAPPR